MPVANLIELKCSKTCFNFILYWIYHYDGDFYNVSQRLTKNFMYKFNLIIIDIVKNMYKKYNH